MAYKTKELVEGKFDFSKVYPEKQQSVRESTGLDFDLSGIVKFLQRQTNNFTLENPVAKDLDNAVFELVRKWESESGVVVEEAKVVVKEVEPSVVEVKVEEPKVESKEVLPPDIEAQIQEWTDAIQSLQTLIETTDDEALKQEWKEAIGGLEYAIEFSKSKS